MNERFVELAKGIGQSCKWRRALGPIGIGLACAGRMTAWADWTPPESSVTPPAVVTLDAFARPYLNGAHPSTALVVGSDGALYGSTTYGGANGYYGTLFRLELNGNFTKLHDFDSYGRSTLVVGVGGALYGSTGSSGTNYAGTLFRLEANGDFTTVYNFSGTDGSQPLAPLVVGPGGALYGSTQSGGAFGWGTLFRWETNGTFTKLHDFNSDHDGSGMSSALVVGPDGALYGSTQNGGIFGWGTLFRLDTSGKFSKLHDFLGAGPLAPLVVGPYGALYGSTAGDGTNYAGTLFRVETNGTFADLYDFNGDDGATPSAALVVGPDGALYGSTYKGGTNGNGALFRLATNGTFVKLHDFNGDDGATPSAALVVGPDGALYGSTQAGGTNNNGAFFRLETNGSFTKLRDLSAYTDGSNPVAALVEGPDGMLYGSAQSGGASGYGAGTLFRLESNGSFTKLYDFNGGSEGYQPSAALAVGPDGALYGSTYNGGAKNYGMLFRVEADSTFTKLYDFDKSDGVNPSAALVVGPDGALYGSAYNYGRWGGGTLFRVETNGNFSKLHDFNHLDGLNPDTALVVGPGSALYGTTYEGGLYRLGTLFRVGTNGSFTNVHVFDGTNGSSPSAALVTGPDGALYGSAQYGGTRGYGALFRLQANGSFTNVHAFDGTNGAYPSAALVVGPDGALYGSTEEGGTSNRGTLFRFEANGSFSKLHDFNGTDGAYGYQPPAALVVGPDGALYGSTANGGTHGYGTLFRLQTDGSFTKLHDFNGTDGAYGYQRSAAPALVVGPDGALYGSTDRGGTNGYGTLFRVDTNAIFTKLYDFNGANGAGPSTPLVVGPDGALYGSTPGGGPRQGGILFKVVLNRAPVARCHDVTVSARANCGADASVDNGSFDPDTGDTITVRQEPPGPYPLGKTAVTLSVTDNHAASNSCAATVTVVDTTPPTISDVTASPNVLWPANHKMVDVVVNYTAMDDCGTVSNALFVASNEAPNGGAGDWVIEDEHHVQLRAERASAGTGRVYSITVISTDKAGNSATKTATVTVPKSHGK